MLRSPSTVTSPVNLDNAPSDAMVTDDADSEMDKGVTVPGHLLSSWAAIIGGIFIVLLAILGAWEYFLRVPESPFLRWFVINTAALILVGLYLHDVLKFAPDDIFQREESSDMFSATETNVWRGRNFYGALTIEQSEDPHFPEENKRLLQHGRITHGTQYLESPRRNLPTTYYSKSSGVSIAIELVSQRPHVHIGAIGLGTGTLAAYAAPESSTSSASKETGRFALTVYEINPLVVSLSEGKEPWFTYLQDAKDRGAKVEIVLGDARLMMEREPTREFDVLAVDAFSGDSIPTHLLTDEAMQIYLRHLRSDGILAVHISNRYLDLEPVCKALAQKYGLQARTVESDDESEDDAYTSTWVLLSRDGSLIEQIDDASYYARRLSSKPGILWTDAYSSLYEVLQDSEADDALAVITSSHWYQKTSGMRPDIELKSETRWLNDGWHYFRTWPIAKEPHENYQLRVKDNRLEVLGDAKAWQSVE
jgi:hypothetical protein